MTAVAPVAGRAEKTRQSILDAAEHLFAERGFAATRLEDIAEQVGIRRASMVYHFKDKRELYNAVITGVLDGLANQMRDAVMERGIDPQARIEAAVGAWVDYVGKRPTTARILLRELANAGRELPAELFEAALPIARLVRSQFMKDESVRELIRKSSDQRIDPMQVASTIAGATLFFVAATPLISRRAEFNPLDDGQIRAHKEEQLRVVRRLLRFDER